MPIDVAVAGNNFLTNMGSTMKILQVISYFNPKFGGDVNVCYNLSKQLVRRGHEVTIITTDYGYNNGFGKDVMNDGIQVIPFPTAVNFGLFIYTPSINKWLKDHIGEYDVVHMHNFRSYQNASIVKHSRKNKVPCILQAHGSVLPFFEKTGLKKIYDLVWGRKILENISTAIALCANERDQYRKMGIPESKIEIIPNGLDLSNFANLPAKGSFRSKYGISEGEQIILYLGRIHKIKGIEQLIDAYIVLIKENKHLRLVITGPDENYLITIKGKIDAERPEIEPIITGPLYGEEKLEAFVDADIYVLPSIYETFPMTVLESWACGTSVIVTEGCLIRDIVRSAGMVSSSNANELASCISYLLTHDSLRERLGEAGQELVNTQYNYETIIDRLESHYSDVVQKQDFPYR